MTAFPGYVSGNLVDDLPYTAPSSAATIEVFGSNYVRTANAAATTVTNFSFGLDGQRLIVEADANTAIANNANIKRVGGTNWTPGAGGGTLNLVRNGAQRKEMARATY